MNGVDSFWPGTEKLVAVLSRSVPLQRCVAIAMAVAICCFTALTHAREFRPSSTNQQFGCAKSAPDQCLVAWNGSSNVLPAAPVLKPRVSAIPDAVLSIIAQAQRPPSDFSRASARTSLDHASILVGTVELRL